MVRTEAWYGGLVVQRHGMVAWWYRRMIWWPGGVSWYRGMVWWPGVPDAWYGALVELHSTEAWYGGLVE
jgi:hypothetical protein